jgi:hypothetical protein
MFKSAAVSLVLVVGLLVVAGGSLSLAKEPPTGEDVAQTGTAIEYPPNPPSVEPCAPTEATCAAYRDAAVERQWQFAASEVLRSLGKAPEFTSNDRKQLAEHEKNRSARQKFLLRLAALNQLAQR